MAIPYADIVEGQAFTIDGQPRTSVTREGRVFAYNTAVADAPDEANPELIALGNIPDTDYVQPDPLPTGVAAVLRYTEGGVQAFRMIGTDGRSTYTLTAP